VTRFRTAAGLTAIIAVTLLLASSSPISATQPGTNGRIAFSMHVEQGEPATIWTINPDGTGLTQLSSIPGRVVAWSPAGNHLAFSTFSSYDTSIEEHAIFRIREDGSALTKLLGDAGGSLLANPSGISWSPDGDTIAFDARPAGPELHEIYTIDSDGSNLARVTTGVEISEDPSWSPDGAKFTFVRWPGAFFSVFSVGTVPQVWTMNIDGTDAVQLTSGDDFSVHPDWSPDGTRIAFTRGSQANTVWVMNADGSNQTQISPPGIWASFPSWSPEGDQIAFSANGEVWIMNVDGSDAHSVATLPGSAGGPAWGPVPTPTADADLDGVLDSTDNCRDWPNAGQELPPWSIPANDSDCDGYSATNFVTQRASEAFLGTHPTDKCADTATPFDERGPDFGEPLSPWPPDINDDGWTTLQDALPFGALWNTISGQDANYSARFDLNGDGRVTLPDVLSLAPFFNKFCAIGATGNLVPFQIDNNPGPCFDANEEPIFTSMCPIWMAAQDGIPRVILDLQAPGDYCSFSPGTGDIEELIENGAPGICLINETDDCDPNNNGPWYDCVAVQDGNPKKVIDGMVARLAKDGGCDGPDPGVVDDFFETINLVFDTGDPLTSIYEARDCDDFTPGKQMSPRLVSLIVLEEPPSGVSGSAGYPILAIAGFYLAGCAAEGEVVIDESDLDRYCGLDTGSPGQAVVYGRLVNMIF